VETNIKKGKMSEMKRKCRPKIRQVIHDKNEGRSVKERAKKLKRGEETRGKNEPLRWLKK